MKVLDVLNAPWAILPEKMAEIERRAVERPDQLLTEFAAERLAAPRERSFNVRHGVAVIPIAGVLGKRADGYWFDSGMDGIGADFAEALEDPGVHSIVFDIDSPGGTVDGTLELARMIREARGVKPMVSFGNGLMASAAYWIGSAADRIELSGETTFVGSIGVIATHFDLTGLAQKFGITVTHITAGKYKAVGSPFKPLDEGFSKPVIQARVDELYRLFVGAVAVQRNATPERVLADMADGRLFTGEQAIRARLADGFTTLDQLISQLNSTPRRSAGKEGRMKTFTFSQEELDAKLAQEREAGKAEATTAAEKARTDAASAADKAKTDAATAAAKQERERVTAIQALGAKNPGHEALIAEMVADGQTTLEQAKARLHDANDAKRTARLDALKTGAPKPLAAPPAPPEGRDRAPTYNPAQLGAQARIWRQEQLRAGRPCTAQEAMDHVLAEAGLPVGSALLEGLQQQA